MYHRSSSPILDIPDFPALRRVKPLPKRRRTLDPNDPNPPIPDGLPTLGPLQMPGPDATAEELLAHAEQLSAQMALQSYYMPILGGVQDLLRNSINGNLDDYTSARLSQAISLGVDFAAEHGHHDRVQAEDEDERGTEGDFMDHLQQPGNTKKRKVPTNMTGSRHQDPSSGDDDGGGDAAATSGTMVEGSDLVEVPGGVSSLSTTLAPRRGKLSAVTRAGLKHKEMLKTRKRQLAAVLGALSLGDPLALDQALSANYPASYRFDDPKQPPPPIRFSRRRGPRIARAIRKLGHPDRVALPECEFTFTCDSSTSKRVAATKEEVAMLRSRFEAELARQAAKAAKLAAASKSPTGTSSRSGRMTKRDRARGRTGRNDGHQNAEFLDPTQPRPGGMGQGSLLPSSSSLSSGAAVSSKARGKKKKRSALANASNPHHLRNYVPSRLPHSGGASNTTSQTNELGPLPLRFLSADLAPSKKKTSRTGSTGVSQLTNPADEWVCAYCEYELFFGDEHDYRRAIRNRKKILKRRRRAQERAAAAASGQRKNKVGEVRDEAEDEEDEEFEDDYEDEQVDYGRGGPRWRDDKGGGGGDQGAFG